MSDWPPPESAPVPPASTPAASERPPRKWLGRRGGLIILGVFVAVWIYLLVLSAAFAPFRPPEPSWARVLSPFLLLTGSFGVAAAFLYTMAYRLRPQDKLSVPFLILVALVGGAMAALFASPINTIFTYVGGGTSVAPSALALGLAGVVEEFAKIAAVVILAWRLPLKNVRNGLFVGGAVGFGFSAFENMSYLEVSWADGAAHGSALPALLATTVLRELTGPFLHPMFTALLAAAVFGASRNGRFRLTWGVVGAYLAVAAAHSFYDSSGNLANLLTSSSGLAFLLSVLADLALFTAATLVWWRVAKHAHASAFAEIAVPG